MFKFHRLGNSSRRDLEPFRFLNFAAEQEAVFLVGAQHEMRGRGEHALDGGEFFRDERRDLLQARAVDEHQQVVAAGHEVAGFHLVELADALGQAVEAAAALGRDAHLDDGAHCAGFFVGKVQHRAKAGAFTQDPGDMAAAEMRGYQQCAAVGRLVEQKGIELIMRLLPALCQQGIQVILLGIGEPKYENALADMMRRFQGFVYYSSKFDDHLAHQIYAGCDMFLMPSSFEPCGLGQLISFKYGTVPICFKTGGLADTVIDVTLDPKKGTGFVFSPYESEELSKAIQRAILLYNEPEKWTELVKHIMHLNYSWKESARQYAVLYERIRNLEV